jgi:pumilio homology domain family member 6
MSRKERPHKVSPSLIGLTSSKKDVTVRREELLESISKEFLDIVANDADELMRNPLTIQIVQEILLRCKGDKTKAVNAVVGLAAGDTSSENHIIQLSFTARVYKTLVQGGPFNAKGQKVEGMTLSLLR